MKKGVLLLVLFVWGVGMKPFSFDFGISKLKSLIIAKKVFENAHSDKKSVAVGKDIIIRKGAEPTVGAAPKTSYPNFTGASLKGLDLSGYNFEGAMLQNSNLNSANISGANFKYANLRGSFFSKADCEACNMSKTNLSNTNFWKANMQNVNMTGAILDGSFFWEVNLSKSILYPVSALGAQFHRAFLYEVDARGANFQGAIFKNAFLWLANLEQADLRGANLCMADLQNAKISGAKLKGALVCKNTIWIDGEPMTEKLANKKNMVWVS